MTGERDLPTLLAQLAPVLMEGEFVFLSFPDAHYGDHAELAPVAACRESEGWTLVVPKATADAHGLAYQGTFQAITLSVHSSLQAIGLSAWVAQRLAEHQISANVVAGFYHDHIFVPTGDSERALIALKQELP